MPSPSVKSLVVVESPAKATTISRFLGRDYQVEASYGHVRDLPQNAKEIPPKVRKEPWARLGVNVEGGFEPVYVVPADKKKHVQRLKAALEGAGRLLLATDEDREGESISWHVLELLKPGRSVEVQRIVFHEVTPEAIREALASPRGVDQNLVRAQEARRVLDRLYGYSLSPLLWKRVAPGLSAGRVQSVAVRLLVERERERMAFRGASYWDLAATLKAAAGDAGSFEARLVRAGGRRLADGKSFDPATGALTDRERLHLRAERARALAEAAAAARPWTVAALETKPGQQHPAPPFITSTLQQEANRKLGFSARRTMRTAQQLYEGIDLGGERTGLITYMRTDSTTLAGRAVAQARTLIEERYGRDFLPAQPVAYRTKAKNAQEAHEAIRPTDLARRPQDARRFLDDDQARLYELIWQRTIACQMVPARFERTAVEIVVEAGGEELVFAASGRRIVHPGFLRAYVEGSDDPEAELGDRETLLPALAQGQRLEPSAVEAVEHATQPPYRYTEASLVKKLEEEGIGRPSTYASILSTIQERGYVFQRAKELVPTFTAFCVTQLLEEQFGDLVDTGFTAHMEDDLDEIAAGKLDWDRLVAAFFLGADGKAGLQQRVEEGAVSYPAVEIGKDPESGEPLVVKVGRYGPYLRRGGGNGARGEGAARSEGARSEGIVSLPEDLPPADLTIERALEMLRAKGEEPEPVAADPATGRPVYLRHGRFGFYLEREPSAEEKAAEAKPHRVSLPRGLEPAEVDAETARALISLPRTIGRHPEDGEPVSAAIGRFGPYVKHGSDFRSVKDWRQAVSIGLDEALSLLAQPKPGRGGARRGAAKTVLKELGQVAGAAGPVQVLDGRYGPYVSDGETNATLPKGSDPQAVTPEEAAALLDARRGQPKTKGRARRRK